MKLDFWSHEGAKEQLEAGIGWYMASDPSEQPEGWISCRELPEYRTLQIDTMGADEAGRLAVNHKLGGLIDQCLAYDAQQGYVNLSFIIKYVWLTQTGFRPSGIIHRFTESIITGFF